MLLVSELRKKLGVTDFVSEINFVENYTDIKKKSSRNSTRGLKLKISKASRSTILVMLITKAKTYCNFKNHF